MLIKVMKIRKKKRCYLVWILQIISWVSKVRLERERLKSPQREWGGEWDATMWWDPVCKWRDQPWEGGTTTISVRGRKWVNVGPVLVWSKRQVHRNWANLSQIALVSLKLMLYYTWIEQVNRWNLCFPSIFRSSCHCFQTRRSPRPGVWNAWLLKLFL